MLPVDFAALLSVSSDLGHEDQTGGNWIEVWMSGGSVSLGWPFDSEDQPLVSSNSGFHIVYLLWNYSRARTC